MDSHISLLKDIKYILICIFVFIIINSVYNKMHIIRIYEKTEKISYEIKQKYYQERENLKDFMLENTVILVKEDGKYTFKFLKEEN